MFYYYLGAWLYSDFMNKQDKYESLEFRICVFVVVVTNTTSTVRRCVGSDAKNDTRILSIGNLSLPILLRFDELGTQWFKRNCRLPVAGCQLPVSTDVPKNPCEESQISPRGRKAEKRYSNVFACRIYWLLPLLKVQGLKVWSC